MLTRIAAVMGCAPADDDDLVEAVRLLVADRDKARAALAAERARCAAVCREVAAFYHQEDIGSVVARACADEIERGT
jgi:hypothetical protein